MFSSLKTSMTSCVCVCVVWYVCMYMSHMTSMGWLEHISQELVFSFYHMGPWNWTQLIGLVYLYPLSHISGFPLPINKPSISTSTHFNLVITLKAQPLKFSPIQAPQRLRASAPGLWGTLSDLNTEGLLCSLGTEAPAVEGLVWKFRSLAT